MPFNTTKAELIHNHKYDYSKVVYVDVYTKVEILCPIHGAFWQSPKIHLYSKGGCKQCANARITGIFDVETAHQIHKGKYDYSKVVYKNVDTKVEIICPRHGVFRATPYKHIREEAGCPICKGENSGNRTRCTVNQFIDKARTIHGDYYNYSNVIYQNSHTLVDITCPNHGSFLQTPTNHIDGPNGCPKCSSSVSRTGTLWLDALNIPHLEREKLIIINGRRYKVDGFDPLTNTVYEYFGVFWHGCPKYTDHTKNNPKNYIPYKTLYEETLRRIITLETAGFIVVYEWGL